MLEYLEKRRERLEKELGELQLKGGDISKRKMLVNEIIDLDYQIESVDVKEESDGKMLR
jgi:hypothetical protein